MTSRTFSRLSAAVPAWAMMAGLALSACAATGTVRPNEELAKLESDCKTRGGILTPSGRATGRENLDNVCRISGGPSDRLRPHN